MSRVNLESSLLINPVVKSGLRYGFTVLADANASLTPDMGPVITITPGAARTLTLPAVDASMRGLTYIFINRAAFTVTVNNAAAAAVAVLPATAGATSMIVCLGDSTLPLGGWIGGL